MHRVIMRAIKNKDKNDETRDINSKKLIIQKIYRRKKLVEANGLKSTRETRLMNLRIYSGKNFNVETSYIISPEQHTAIKSPKKRNEGK